MLGWELPPHHSGGLGVACYEMCKEISAQGIDIEFILPYTAEFDVDFMRVTPAHHQSAETVHFAGSGYTPELFSESHIVTHKSEQLDLRMQHDLFALNVAKLAESKEFDIIHAHDWLTFRAGLLAKKVSGKPLIAHVHATQFDQSGGNYGNPLAREIEQAALSEADVVFAVSQYTKDILVREYGIAENKITVVHNSVSVPPDIDESTSVHRYLEVMKQNGYSVVVNIGRQTMQKGLTKLLDAARLVVSINPKVLFVLAGSGEQKNELLELAAEYGISRNVIIEDWLSGKRLHDTFRIADVFVMPSVSEPFGLVALEAISLGVPVIVSKQSGVAEVLSHALKADFWDTHRIADMILQVVEHSGLRHELWQNSFTEYSEITWSRSVDVMKQRYHTLSGVG